MVNVRSSYRAGAGVSVSGITVTTSMIADNAVTEPKIATGAVSTRTIADYSVVESKIATGAVSNRTIALGAIDSTKIAAGAISANLLASDAKAVEATVFVAASDASPKLKGLADFVCTGSGDQDTLIAALNALPASGGRIKLSEGTYNFSGAFTINKSNVWLQGSGFGTKIQGAVSDSYIKVLGGLSNVKITDLQIDGSSQPSGPGYFGIVCYNANNIEISNCYVHDTANNGIEIEGANNGVIARNIVQGVKSGPGISLAAGATNIKVIGNQIMNTVSSNGMDVNNASHNTIIGNTFIGNAFGGITISNTSQYNTVVGNVVDYSAGGSDIFTTNTGTAYNILANNILVSTGAVLSVNDWGGSDYNLWTGNIFLSGKTQITAPNSLFVNNLGK
jgi:parallel beta-helix repeat protein